MGAEYSEIDKSGNCVSVRISEGEEDDEEDESMDTPLEDQIPSERNGLAPAYRNDKYTGKINQMKENQRNKLSSFDKIDYSKGYQHQTSTSLEQNLQERFEIKKVKQNNTNVQKIIKMYNTD